MILRRVNSIAFCFLFIYLRAAGTTVDLTTSRPNTLFDDADDLQKQLDNEARDKIKYGRTKTIWIFHLPTHYPRVNLVGDVLRPTRDLSYLTNTAMTTLDRTKFTVGEFTEWSYKNQYEWYKQYPNCGGRSQSPVNLPVDGLIKVKGARNVQFCNYDVIPSSLSLTNDGKRVVLFGEWDSKRQPLIYGGACHSRRYIFHSLVLHWPSEHVIGGLLYPIESQAIHISAEYKTMEDALKGTPKDPQAILGVSNIYKYSSNTQQGLKELIDISKGMNYHNGTLVPRPLSFFCPPFKEYVCYQGSLTSPPCTESVLWIIRARALGVSRGEDEVFRRLMDIDGTHMQMNFRQQQCVNDRKIFIFN